MASAIQFSGGKDSAALLHMLKDRRSEMTVYFGDSGAVYPHVLRFVRETCEQLGFPLRIVVPAMPINEFQARFGLPSDILPVEASAQMQPYIADKRAVLLQSPLTCCAAMVWRPMQEAMLADGITDIYRGSKKVDGHVGVPDGHVDAHGITYHSPLWEWSDAEVFTFLERQGAALPEHYRVVNSSFDCLTCTAFLNHPGAAGRLRWTQAHYPQSWPQIAARLTMVRDVVAAETALVAESMNFDRR
jgi:phosphoadenosine phosphosulfate reductase